MTGNAQPRTAPAADKAERRSARLIPWMFVGSFLVVAAVNGVMIAFAVGTFSGVTTEHPYEEGIAYNAAIAAARAQAALGWQVAVDFSALAGGPARLAVTLRDRGGNALTGAALTAHFLRPASGGFDTTADLRETGSGRYEAEPRLALPGQWDMVVTAAHDGASYQKTQRVFVRE